MGELCKIAIGSVHPNLIAMREVNRESEDYLGMVASMRQKGFIGAITVRKREFEGKTYYEIIDGLHRYNACLDAGIDWINADIVDLDDEQILEHQIMASVHRVETKPIEYSIQLKRILARNPLMTMAELSLKLGKSTHWLTNRLSLNKITNDHIKKLIDNGKIPLMNAYAIAKLPNGEQIHWVDRAMCQPPQEFMRAARRGRAMAEGQQFYNSKLGMPISQVHDEVAVTFPNKAVVPRRAKIKDEIAKMKVFMEKALADGVKGIFEGTGSLTMKDIRPQGDPIKVIPSGYELLHGVPRKPKFSEVKIKYEIVFKGDRDPIVRKGWDHVELEFEGQYAYCHGDVLVYSIQSPGISDAWMIKHPTVKIGNEFNTEVAAMDFVEENFDGH